MRLPGFTADGSFCRVVVGYSQERSAGGEAAIGRLVASNRVVSPQLRAGAAGYVCTPDNKACACSGFDDCFSCALDPRACGAAGRACVCRNGACGCSLHAF